MTAVQSTLKQYLKSLSKDAVMPSKKVIETTPFPPCNPALIQVSELTLASALLMGMDHAGVPLYLSDTATFQVHTPAFEPLPFEQALDFFKGTVSVTKEEWNALEPRLRFRAFTVARLTEADHIEMLRGRLLQALETSDDFASVWKDVQALSEAVDRPFSAGYFETVYRTNMQTAYNAGRLMQYQHHAPPAWQLLFIEDTRTSHICKGLAALAGGGTALARTHPFWKTYGFPPYHFNCRTTFRAVYADEIGHGVQIAPIPMKEVRKHFKPQKGFGGNPIEKESWWRLTDTMKERINRYGLQAEVQEAAKAAGIDNFDVRLAHEAQAKRWLHGTDFYASIIEGAEPKQHEVEIAKKLAEKGYTVLFTPENTFIKGVKNPEGIITNFDKIVEMKKIDSADLNKLRKRMVETSKQHAQIAVLHIVGDKNYTEKEAAAQVRATFKEIKHNEQERKDSEESRLEEVWLLWNGKLKQIKK